MQLRKQKAACFILFVLVKVVSSNATSGIRWHHLITSTTKPLTETERELSRATFSQEPMVAAQQRLVRRSAEVERKIKAARAYAQKESVVKPSDVVYSSDLDALEQTGMEDGLQEDFDRRLSER